MIKLRDISDHVSPIISSWLSTLHLARWCQHYYRTQHTAQCIDQPPAHRSLVELPGIAQSCMCRNCLQSPVVVEAGNCFIFPISKLTFTVFKLDGSQWNPPLAVTSNNWSFKKPKLKIPELLPGPCIGQLVFTIQGIMVDVDDQGSKCQVSTSALATSAPRI